MNYVTGEIGYTMDRPSAVSLGKFDGLHRGHRKLLDEVLKQKKNGLASVIDDYKKRCITLNSAVNVTYNKTTVQGICTDIKADGSIEVTSSDGVITVNSGEVSVRGIYGYV